MLSIKQLVELVKVQTGKVPGNADYAKSLKAAILEHYEILEENLTAESLGKLSNFVKNTATKLKGLLTSAQTFEKMLSAVKDQVSYSIF